MTSTGYKVYANILNKEIIRELDAKNGWSRTQAGFRKGRRIIENVKILKHMIGRRLKRKDKRVWAMFIDLKAAFDNLDRNILWGMMKKRGITAKLIERVREIYDEVKCRIRVGGIESEEFWVEKGVRQGCPLSPTLFNIYIADIEEELIKSTGGVKIRKEKVRCLKYADDIAIVAEEEEGLRGMIKTMKKYLKGKKLELNVKKTKIMCFRKGGRKEKVRLWWWEEELIEEVKEFKYLVYVMKKNIGEEKHIEKRVGKQE